VTVLRTRTAFFPLLAGPDDQQVSAAHLTDGFLGDLSVAYSAGPPYGQRLLTWDELGGLGLVRGDLRREAAENLHACLDRVGIHGQPPALMLSFDGLESSLLLARPLWDDLEQSVPGDLVVGVPARDVVIFTGSQSRSGLQKVRRAVDRVFFAGGPHLLSRDLLVRRQRRWEVFGSEVPAPAGPASAPPGYGRPASAPPGYGRPASAPPGYGHPASAPPGHGHPASAPPGHGHPASAPPGHGHPYSVPPAYGRPASGPPAWGGPASAPPGLQPAGAVPRRRTPLPSGRFR
jgi:hypothetical protein